jgi:transcriptional regulator with XRE-family HTH domain
MFLETLGDRLKFLRNLRNLTVTQLAKDLNISAGNITRYENNNIKPSADTIVLFSNYFDISTDWILLQKGKGPNTIEKDKYTYLTKYDNIRKTDNLISGWIDRLKFSLHNFINKPVEVVEKDLKLRKNSLDNYLSNHSIPSLNIICKLAKYFNTSTDWLLTGIDPSMKDLDITKKFNSVEYMYAKQIKDETLIDKYENYFNQLTLNDREIELINKFRKISEYDKNELEMLIDMKSRKITK